MPVRLGQLADENRVGELCSRAFWNDELMAKIMHPHREQYPDCFADFFKEKFRKAVTSPSHCALVSTMLDRNGNQIVTGFADWIRRGSNEADVTPNETNVGSIENLAADPTKMDILERAIDFTKHYWSCSRAETWFLDLLGVDPAYQGHGIGRMLTKEGIKLAERDQVCASLVASLSGYRLYLSCGFKPVGWVSEGDGNPLRGLPSGQIMFWDAESTSQPQLELCASS